jgi:hypothetical protein
LPRPVAVLLIVDDAHQKAFDFAQETTKQLLTLATGIIALTITFLKDVAGTASHDDRLYLQWGWIVYLVSIAFGVLTLMALTGNLERPGDGGSPSIYRGNIRLLSIGQIAAFFIGTVLIVIFAIKVM